MHSVMKRIFAAIKTEPGEKFINTLSVLRSRLCSEHIKWVESCNFHVTLKFFGETDEGLIPGISETLGTIAGKNPKLNFNLSGLGIFGSSYQPKVIWAGIHPHEPLALLMKIIQKEMEPYGFESDRQNIVPHLTIGRIKFLNDKVLFRRVVEENRSIQSDFLKITDCILYESILLREGPKYNSLGRFQFGK